MARSLYFTNRQEYYRQKLAKNTAKLVKGKSNLLSPREWNSDCVSSLEYEEEEEKLTIHFQKRGSYAYFGFPPHAFAEFNYAESRGEYFNLYIRNAGYAYERIG